MNKKEQFCHNEKCESYGIKGKGNIVIHSKKEKRYKCKDCGKTFSQTKGTVFYNKQYNMDIIKLVVGLSAFGCPIQAIVFAFGINERTVMAWLQASGEHCKRVHEEQILKPKELKHVQSDEMYVKGFKKKFWMAFSICAETRLWLGGYVSQKRDGILISKVIALVKLIAIKGNILIATDGLSAYKTAILKAFREKILTGKRGRPKLKVWDNLNYVQVIKNRIGNRILEIKKEVVSGSLEAVEKIIAKTKTGNTINTSYVERINSTFRSRMSFSTRKTRYLLKNEKRLENMMYLVGTFYNFCIPHKSLSEKKTKMTPAMKYQITNKIWSSLELLSFKISVNNLNYKKIQIIDKKNILMTNHECLKSHLILLCHHKRFGSMIYFGLSYLPFFVKNYCNFVV
jgi:transposase-like protein